MNMPHHNLDPIHATPPPHLLSNPHPHHLSNPHTPVRPRRTPHTQRYLPPLPCTVPHRKVNEISHRLVDDAPCRYVFGDVGLDERGEPGVCVA